MTLDHVRMLMSYVIYQEAISFALPLSEYLRETFIWELGRSSAALRHCIADTEMLTAT
jgi:hypothetical protein